MEIVEQLIFFIKIMGLYGYSLYTNYMYNFMQTKLIFRGPAKSAMADSVWSRGGARQICSMVRKIRCMRLSSLYIYPGASSHGGDGGKCLHFLAGGIFFRLGDVKISLRGDFSMTQGDASMTQGG